MVGAVPMNPDNRTPLITANFLLLKGYALIIITETSDIHTSFTNAEQTESWLEGFLIVNFGTEVRLVRII